MTVNKMSIEDRLQLIHEVLKQKKSINRVAKENGIRLGTLSDWVYKYKTYGEDAIHPYRKKYTYREIDKIAAVEEVLFEGASKRSVIRKYHISSKAVLLAWISNYNKQKELKNTGKGLSQMKKRKPSKKVTIKERIEIVQYTLAHGTNYQAAIDKYDVSYQQVYVWVKKYKELGIAGLQNKLGRNQSIEELSEIEKLRLENAQLRNRNEYLEMEQAFAKKLQALKLRDKIFR
ncbi:helix-turn-helix domain-containing protein [Enterococcus faecalis]|uniref:helix-turn-helix domain-containing protein n=3 Tax=Enterococcus faecalis TaxID=1351 RepID=UPI00032F5A10|nr:helix-turn-helix domain-containing protein [Enterococcus faecalis]EGO7772996.1 transposase [Enterococcus faecalis]EHB5039343.1 transposase [Enterococcus faecalis]EHB5039869.1 transposase [Enterococcus faecalis]EHP0969644.1 transposase [Enterococcus faecalis]EHP0971993.1 transposase [Enterococcus faecalis]